MGCVMLGSSLEKLDLSTFNTQHVTDMGAMFRGCSSLKELDQLFVLQNGVGTTSMFAGCNRKFIVKMQRTPPFDELNDNEKILLIF